MSYCTYPNTLAHPDISIRNTARALSLVLSMNIWREKLSLSVNRGRGDSLTFVVRVGGVRTLKRS